MQGLFLETVSVRARVHRKISIIHKVLAAAKPFPLITQQSSDCSY